MADVLLFHSVVGLRPAVLATADRLRAAGHRVVTPDLYDGRTADSIDDGFAIHDDIGRVNLRRRAREAARELPGTAVLAGLSLGASFAAELAAERPETPGLLFWHGAAGDPATVRAGLPVQVHLADPDEFEPADEVAAWRKAMVDAGAELEIFTYPGAGHLYTDDGIPGYDEAATRSTWERSLAFLARF
ncbi:dienelactone hydrolase family protein [Micromonospora sp. NPDC049559]|uniref:dienelactone hydrolase family protein n=1 Tax=Micromonospora sp. NPDC049559 TaxID=3155923 RepID=UPI0034236E18